MFGEFGLGEIEFEQLAFGAPSKKRPALVRVILREVVGQALDAVVAERVETQVELGEVRPLQGWCEAFQTRLRDVILTQVQVQKRLVAH